MSSRIDMRKVHVREAVIDVQKKLHIAARDVRVEPMYRDSVFIYFKVSKPRPFHRDIIRDRFEELCLTHGWKPPRVDKEPTWAPHDDDYTGFTVDLRRTSSLSKSEALLSD